jgi:hypothetical protein
VGRGEVFLEYDSEQMLRSARFAVGAKLGEGETGSVYEAEDRERNARVALKALRRLSPEEVLRFKGEFRKLQDLHHPNLVSLGELVEERGHWYSVGVLLYQALTGRLPFTGRLHEMLAAKARQPPTPPESHLPGLPQDLCRLCMELLHTDPTQRPYGEQVLRLLGVVGVFTFAAGLVSYPVVPAEEGGPAWVRGAFHVHTTRSDGQGSVEQVARAARVAGLQFVVLAGYNDYELREPAWVEGVLVVPGVKLSTAHGHLSAFGLEGMLGGMPGARRWRR